MQSVEIIEADLSLADHRSAVIELVDLLAKDPSSGGVSLSNEVRENLIQGLQEHPTTLILLAFHGDEAIGIAMCFVGFSTFFAKRLINIHDLVVASEFRGRGVGTMLLNAVEQKARSLECCKVTLEVLQTNERAMRIYGDAGYMLPSRDKPGYYFLTKQID